MTDVTFPTPAGGLQGYLAQPSTPARSPGVVILHESFGLNADIRAWADRFAAEGYVALAPDLYSWGAKPRCVLATFRALMSGKGRALGDIEAARAYVAARTDCTGSVGVCGFCMGGGFALLTAARGFAAAADNYGDLPRNADEVLHGACPIVASYGARDRMLRGRATKLDGVLERAGVEHDVREYPEASHSFLNRHEGRWAFVDRVTGIGHHGPSADDAWRRILSFFDRHVAAR